MSGSIRVEVTAEDIEKGRRGQANRCPVRRAMRRAGLPVMAVFGKDCDLQVFPYTARLPIRVEEWINRYDEGWTVRPFSFQYRIPDA